MRTSLDSADPAHQPRGSLTVVGIGPTGCRGMMTPDVREAIWQAEDLVGFEGYLNLLNKAVAPGNRHHFGLGDEVARCHHAIGLAAEGRRVVMVCSGDGGIYAMGSLVLETIASHHHREDRLAQGIELVMMPGITAMQALSAAAGAMLGHDFCAISLSTLLTPRETIWKRVTHAVAGDFVMALYNPRSRQRATFLQEVIDHCRAHRSATTPVAVGRALGSDQQTVVLHPLGEINTETVDMHTTLIVGNSQSCIHEMAGQRFAYTPRGYGGARLV
ncbi:MAG: precorrin-3B C(17)-methyltransferase [Alphaproteobacteria bacterium]|nr:precorrin-3B C(17)-methyltransferase [Alphaproteobacteria bacterium]